MTDQERIIKIRQARTSEELDKALADYWSSLIAVHPLLKRNYAFNLALERKQYFHALCDIKRACRGLNGGNYQDIVHLLEIAVDKQYSLEAAESPM